MDDHQHLLHIITCRVTLRFYHILIEYSHSINNTRHYKTLNRTKICHAAINNSVQIIPKLSHLDHIGDISIHARPHSVVQKGYKDFSHPYSAHDHPGLHLPPIPSSHYVLLSCLRSRIDCTRESGLRFWRRGREPRLPNSLV